MYKCEDCGREFEWEDAIKISTTHGFPTHYSIPETYYVCPNTQCKSPNIEEVD